MLEALGGASLSVLVNAWCTSPQGPLRKSLEAYDMTVSNLATILGLRYQTEHAVKEMIVDSVGFYAFLRIPEERSPDSKLQDM